MSTMGRILIVEDDPNDVELTLTALGEYNLANEVVIIQDFDQVLKLDPKDADAIRNRAMAIARKNN